MPDKNKFKRGKVSPIAVILVIMLMAAAMAGGWWYGRGGAGPALPGVGPGQSGPAPEQPRFAKPKLQKPRSHESDLSLLLEDRISDAAEETMPAVVNVFSEREVQVQSMPSFNDPLFRRFFGPGHPRAPREQHEQSLGSGVIVTEDGYILTNNHVVADATEVKVALSDKREFEAEIVGTDPETDVAVLKIDASDLPVLPLADSDQVRVGQLVLAIGNPFGLSQSVSLGIVSARGRTKVGITDYEDFIQTDAAINPGNSGGALINLDGELVGINTAIFSRSGGYMGIGFAIPANLARRIMESLVSNGSVQRGWLGVSIQDLTPELAKSFGVSSAGGALVTEVIKGTPADKAGIEPGDLILALDGKAVEDGSGLRNMIARCQPDSKVEIELVRDGDDLTVSVKLGERPDSETLASTMGRGRPGKAEGEAAGMTVADLTPELADQLGIQADVRGVVVVDIKDGSRAQEARVMIGDVIFRMNRQPTKNVAEFERVAEGAGNGSLLLHIRRQGSSLFLVIPEE